MISLLGMGLICLLTLYHNYMLHVQKRLNIPLLFKRNECRNSFYENVIQGCFQGRPTAGEYSSVFNKRGGYSVHHSIIREQHLVLGFSVTQGTPVRSRYLNLILMFKCMHVYTHTWSYRYYLYIRICV